MEVVRACPYCGSSVQASQDAFQNGLRSFVFSQCRSCQRVSIIQKEATDKSTQNTLNPKGLLKPQINTQNKNESSADSLQKELHPKWPNKLPDQISEKLNNKGIPKLDPPSPSELSKMAEAISAELSSKNAVPKMDPLETNATVRLVEDLIRETGDQVAASKPFNLKTPLGYLVLVFVGYAMFVETSALYKKANRSIRNWINNASTSVTTLGQNLTGTSIDSSTAAAVPEIVAAENGTESSAGNSTNQVSPSQPATKQLATVERTSIIAVNRTPESAMQPWNSQGNKILKAVINVPTAIIRSGPGSDYRMVGSATAQMEVLLKKEKDNWMEVVRTVEDKNTNGINTTEWVGWIRKDLVKILGN
jgi:hypothetical protein